MHKFTHKSSMWSLHIKVVCGELWEGIFFNLLIIYAWIAAGLNNSKCDDQNLLLW